MGAGLFSAGSWGPLGHPGPRPAHRNGPARTKSWGSIYGHIRFGAEGVQGKVCWRGAAVGGVGEEKGPSRQVGAIRFHAQLARSAGDGFVFFLPPYTECAPAQTEEPPGRRPGRRRGGRQPGGAGAAEAEAPGGSPRAAVRTESLRSRPAATGGGARHGRGRPLRPPPAARARAARRPGAGSTAARRGRCGRWGGRAGTRATARTSGWTARSPPARSTPWTPTATSRTPCRPGARGPAPAGAAAGLARAGLAALAEAAALARGAGLTRLVDDTVRGERSAKSAERELLLNSALLRAAARNEEPSATSVLVG